MPHKQDRKHAIVIGASMAGLLATRVLADHFEQVTLVERDAFPPEGEHRRGVPQGRHTHGLLAGGKQVVEQLFPGISQELIDGGHLCGFRYFAPSEPEAYRRDVPNAQVHVLDAGHFALDTAADEITALLRGFVEGSP